MIVEPKIGYKVVYKSPLTKGYHSYVAFLFSKYNKNADDSRNNFLNNNPGFVLDFELNKWTRPDLDSPILLFDTLWAAREFINREDETEGKQCSIFRCEYIPSTKKVEIFYPTDVSGNVSITNLLKYSSKKVPFGTVGADLVRPLENLSENLEQIYWSKS